ncbi:hypothetical protein [Candidatus Borrarchaeum sp.]|uniref:hypothetical protein n=1 Tax=Candidatus Borrarchaeum sp. TaxID=2846742 RepID=UPI00257C6FDF|nr:hypothetical protein [Candidatus Borrarchaeum sp.]
MVKRNENNDCERCLIYPVKINAISREENIVIIEVDSLEELTMIAEGFKKPLLHDETHHLVIFDKEIHYRTKNVDL